MAGTAIISTFYNLEPQMLCIREFAPTTLILLKQAEGPKAAQELEANEALLRKAVGKFVRIDPVDLKDQFDIYDVAEKTVKLIDREHRAGNHVILNITGGRRTQAIGVIFGGYARADKVDRIVYAPSDLGRIVDLPKLNLSPSKRKREILELIAKGGHKTMTALAGKLGKTRGMLYIHLRELKEAGYLDEKYGLTMAGRLALL